MLSTALKMCFSYWFVKSLLIIISVVCLKLRHTFTCFCFPILDICNGIGLAQESGLTLNVTPQVYNGFD